MRLNHTRLNGRKNCKCEEINHFLACEKFHAHKTSSIWGVSIPCAEIYLMALLLARGKKHTGYRNALTIRRPDGHEVFYTQGTSTFTCVKKIHLYQTLVLLGRIHTLSTILPYGHRPSCT